MNNNELQMFLKSKKLPEQIKKRIKDVLDEEEAYVADELVILSEEILVQLASLGIYTYLSQSNQKQVFNDFILQLFTTKSQRYNSAPLFRWAANMIKTLNDPISLKIRSLFWKKKLLNEEVNRLGKLRNAVMHGFFILPAKRNHEEAIHIGKVLKQIIDLDIFSLYTEQSFHFLSKEDNLVSFNHNWTINDDQWTLYDKSYSFGVLTKNIQYEFSKKFEIDQSNLIEDHWQKGKKIEKIETFIKSKNKGCFSIWGKPNHNLFPEYSNLIKNLNSEKYLSIFYSLDPKGINITQNFLLGLIINKLSNYLQTESYSKNPRKAIAKLVKQCDKQLIIVLNNIHTSLFNPDHLLHIKDFLYENNIILIAFGFHYPYLDKFFNYSYSFQREPYLPDEFELKESFENYLRFKGPNKDIENENKCYDKLYDICLKLLDTLDKEKIITLRRFADKFNFPAEYVEEAFCILNPFLNLNNAPFELDQLDPLHNSPLDVKESSRLFFTIERRDAKLQYQHKVLSI